ncbi:MAG: hypothetical protein V3W18_00825 [candidate division Zixibacteria bacterium]
MNKALFVLIMISGSIAFCFYQYGHSLFFWDFKRLFTGSLVIIWLVVFYVIFNTNRMVIWFTEQKWQKRLLIAATNIQPILIALVFYPDKFLYLILLYLLAVIKLGMAGLFKGGNIAFELLFLLSGIGLIAFTENLFPFGFAYIILLFSLFGPMSVTRARYRLSKEEQLSKIIE